MRQVARVTSGRDRPEANAGHPAANGSVAVDAADLVARPPITSNLGTLMLHGMQRVLVHFTDPVLGLLFSAALSPGLGVPRRRGGRDFDRRDPG